MDTIKESKSSMPELGLDVGVFAVKGVLLDSNSIRQYSTPVSGNPLQAVEKCLAHLLDGITAGNVRLGLVGNNAYLLARELGLIPLLEIEALQEGLAYRHIKADAVLSLGHENMHYLELDRNGLIRYFGRNGQCAAGSGAFWHQQATRMGYNDRELAEVALQAETPVKISGRCAVFAKSDMTHAINEGATQSAVSAGMAKALVDTVVAGVTQNRLRGPGTLGAVGGVANNKAVMRYLREYAHENSLALAVPPDHEFINALGAALKGTEIPLSYIKGKKLVADHYVPEYPLPALEPSRVHYLESRREEGGYDLDTVYLGVDCGSVSTKCVLLDRQGRTIGGIYLPTTGRPALQVLALMKEVDRQYGELVRDSRIVACTTGSGRFLSQKILNAEYAVDEITCQAEGVKSLFDNEQETLSVIEIGGEDSKFLQIKNGTLYDYNMNPVCAAGTGTFLENLSELLGVKIKDEFSAKAFMAEYAIDLGDTCTILSQSTLMSAASRGLPLNSQLASLAYSSARNYLSKTVENRPLEGRLIFTGATAKNHALAAAFAAECEKDVYVPPNPELTGALGAALVARMFHRKGEKGTYSFRSLQRLNAFELKKTNCKAECEHEHNCTLHVISFEDGSRFIYGDRCGRYSGLERGDKQHAVEDFGRVRERVFNAAAGDPVTGGPRVGIARAGLYYDLFPFWSAFFRELGCEVQVSRETGDETLERGKRALDSEMCFPMKVLVGHYHELLEMNPDFIFIPEVVDMEPLPWARQWPRSFTCPLIQTARGTVVNSLAIDPEKQLYAQLNYRAGPVQITRQLRPVAEKVLGRSYSEQMLSQAVAAGYEAMSNYNRAMERESISIMDRLQKDAGRVVAVFLSRSYTLYDRFVSKGSLQYAEEKNLAALPHDFLLSYLQGWYEGRIKSPFLDRYREELFYHLESKMKEMNNIYPAQLQRILSTALLVSFLNERTDQTGLPVFNLVLQDPFKCGPNAMLRHFLSTLTGYLRLTLDEHTAAAGMITRLEAFRNTCLSRKQFQAPPYYSAVYTSARNLKREKILIPDPTHHSRVFAAMFRKYGVEADMLPRSQDPDLSLARRYANGEECLPFIQNLQDYLEYLEQNGDAHDNVLFFQGWACGPCRYGLYAPLQALAINRAGYGAGKVCAVKLADVISRFGPGFAVGAFTGTLAMDLLYKMLYAVRPYEIYPGSAEALFNRYADRLIEVLQGLKLNIPRILNGSYLKPLEELLAEAADEFSRLPRRSELRPLILLGGEFYVRIDDRNNQDIIRKIEQAGGEVSFAPASEVFLYTVFIDYHEARQLYAVKKNARNYFYQLAYRLLNNLALREEKRLEHAAGDFLEGRHEPSPREIMEGAAKYVSRHYGGEPPMTIGRVAAYAGRERVSGAVFVAPFTCMPSSVVEAQQTLLQEELKIPVTTLYYDGRDSAGREELIKGLVFQARQRLTANAS